RSDVQVWCSHHEHFYLESERFRMSLLAGCVPVKAVLQSPPHGALLPFYYLLAEVNELPERLRSMDLGLTRARFEEEFVGLPSLEDGFAEALAAVGVAGQQTWDARRETRD